MKIAFGQISAGNTHHSIKDAGWFPDEAFCLRELQSAEIDLMKKENETVLLQGELQAVVQFLCDRCAEQFDYVLCCDFHYFFKVGEDSSIYEQELECNEEDFNTVYLDEPVIDIGEILREQALLAAPEWKICSEGCKGLCPGCGAVLAYETCRCESIPADSPFAVLKNFKKH